MFRTTRLASLLVAALAVLAGPRSTLARPMEPPPREPHSVVAQSTDATAGTGRRPISQRIAASNLPLRTPTPPDCAQDARPEAPIAEDVAASAGSVPEDAEGIDADPVSAVDAAPASTLTPAAPPAPEVVADAVTPPQELAAQSEEPAAAPFEPETDAVSEIASTPSLVMPVAAPAPAAPAPSVRESLLKRIKGALGTRPRGPAPATSGPAAAVAATPSPDAEPRSAPRQIPIHAHGSPAIALGQPTLADEAEASPAPDSVAAEDVTGAAPARLEFDVRESRSLVGEGEQIVMRIAVRNVGGETAERVTATLFFAEGIEPVQAIGQSAEVYPGEVRFEAVPQLSPGSSVDMLVTAVGTRPGSVTYRGELECRQLAGRIAREGAVTVRARRVAQP